MPGVAQTGLNANKLNVVERKEKEELRPNILQPSLHTTVLPTGLTSLSQQKDVL